MSEINKRIEKDERVLVTTLTKKMAESLTEFMEEAGIKVRYLHSDVKTIERMEIIRDLRLKKFDVLIGINLLREGLDIPEVSLVAILDADKQGFLRSERSLIQTIGRCARNANGHVIMYADVITDSMRKAIEETARRRKLQQEYNKLHGITPKTIIKDITDSLVISSKVTKTKVNAKDAPKMIKELQRKLKLAVKELDFEQAIVLRDRIKELENNK